MEYIRHGKSLSGAPVPIPLDDELMAEVMRDYLAATNRANELGLDFLEVHAIHGYLLHNFLSPLANTRIDDYGGTLQKPCASFLTSRV